MFKNKEGKIRAGFNIATIMIIFLLTTTIIGTIISLVATVILNATGDLEIVGTAVTLSDRGTVINNMLVGVVMIIQEVIIITTVWIGWTKVMKKSADVLGMKKFSEHKKEFAIGLLIGFVMITLVFALIMITDNATISDWAPHFSWDMLLYLVLFIAVGFAEELLNRGYVMGTLRHTGNNKYVIFGVSMLVFALMHGMNNGMTALSYINLALIAGALAYMYYKSGNIWMCIGYHISWNLFQGLYGFPVSGNKMPKIFNMAYEKDTILNGGTFGPEAGLFVTVISILIIVFTKFYYRNSKNDFMAEK